jgi:hypothetical protein
MYMMRAIRQPQATKTFIRSTYFVGWILSSVLLTAAQLAAPWIGSDQTPQKQLARELLAEGILELVWVWFSLSSIMADHDIAFW